MGGLRTNRCQGDAGNETGAFSLERPKVSLGHVQFIPGQMSNGKWSLKLRSQEGDVGSRCHGGGNRNLQIEVRAEEVDRR